MNIVDFVTKVYCDDSKSHQYVLIVIILKVQEDVSSITA